MKHLLCLLLVFSLLACQRQDTNYSEPATSEPATETIVSPPDSASLIIPGESIGPIKIGMPAEELTKVLGKPDSSDAAMGKALSFWMNKQPGMASHYIAIYTITDFGAQVQIPKAEQVQVTSPEYRTIQGIGTGQTIANIRKQFRNLKPLAYYHNRQQQLVYIFDDQAQGIAFEITLPDSLCTAITIHLKGEDVTETYLPIYPDLTPIDKP